MDDDSQRLGTTVQVGQIDITPFNGTVISFDTDGGSAVSSLFGDSGAAITYPATVPTKTGYVFDKWVTADNSPLPTTFPSANITLTAKWRDANVWSFEDEALNTDVALSNTHGTSTKVINTQSYSGKQALQLNGVGTSGAGRPQIPIKNGDGTTFKLEDGAQYIVSFWVMFPDLTAVDGKFNYWLAGTDRSTAYASGSEKDNDNKLYEKSGVVIEAAANEWFKVEFPITGNGTTGLLLGITGNKTATQTFYLDDVLVEKKVYTTPDANAWSFENETLNTDVALPNSHGTSTKVINAVSHDGKNALQLNAVSNAGAVRPQITLKKPDGTAFQTEDGAQYTMSFYVMFPNLTAVDGKFNYWLTGTNSTTAYANGGEKDGDNKLYEASGVVIDEADKWIKVEFPFVANGATGLRLGITGNKAGAQVFYLDDILITKKIITPPAAGAWSFENEALNTELALPNSNGTSAKVTNAVSHDGVKALQLTGTGKGGAVRPQVTIKNPDGTAFKMENGELYTVSFWVMFPNPSALENNCFHYWVTGTDSTVAYTSGTEKDNDNKLHEASSVAIEGANVWQKVEFSFVGNGTTGLRLGITGNLNATHTFYLDDFLVTKKEFTTPAAGAWSFENEAIDSSVIITNNIGATANVTGAACHDGRQSIKINSSSKAGATRPQITVKKPDGTAFKLKEGKSYTVSFWVMFPDPTVVGSKFNYWLTATDSTAAYTEGSQKDADKLYEASSVAIEAANVWQKVEFTIYAEATIGVRLGITGDANVAHTFYVDDILIKKGVYTSPATDAWSFEYEAADTDVSLTNTNGTTTAVTTEYAHNGNQSLKLNGVNKTAVARPQITLKMANGTDNIKLVNGKKYVVSFYVMFLDPTVVDSKFNYWLTATDSTAAYTDGGQKDTDKLHESSSVAIVEAEEWQKVEMEFTATGNTGLRLGITGDKLAAHSFYIDDITVRVYTEADPDAMNFEKYAIGTQIHNNSSGGTITVSDTVSYTGGQSALIHATNNNGNLRPAFNITDADGNIIKVKKEDDFYVSFYVYVPMDMGAFPFSYWLAVVPENKADEPFHPDTFKKNDYMIDEISAGASMPNDEWVKVEIPIMNCKYDGVLRLGITQGNGLNYVADFYVDDVKVAPPQYITVKFDTNGSLDVIEDMLILNEFYLPADEIITPYRLGYQFMGWYTSKDFSKDTYFDMYETPVRGKNGDVLTLYACWRQWEIVADGSSQQTSEKEYDVEYYTEKVWVGDKNVPDTWLSGDVPQHNEAKPVDVKPEMPTPAEDGMPPWLIVVIIVAAVVIVGGGAALAAILLKKNKKA